MTRKAELVSTPSLNRKTTNAKFITISNINIIRVLFN